MTGRKPQIMVLRNGREVMQILNPNVAIVGGLPIKTVNFLIDGRIYEWNHVTGEFKLVKDLTNGWSSKDLEIKI